MILKSIKLCLLVGYLQPHDNFEQNTKANVLPLSNVTRHKAV